MANKGISQKKSSLKSGFTGIPGMRANIKKREVRSMAMTDNLVGGCNFNNPAPTMSTSKIRNNARTTKSSGN